VSHAVVLLVLAVPYLILALSGLVLFERTRTVATALVAIGFAAVPLSQVVAAIASFRLASSGPDVMSAVGPVRGWIWMASRWAGPAGLWLGSISFLWHVAGARSRGVP
jgi:hypothetical protein